MGTTVALSGVRALIAQCLLGDTPTLQIGSIVLRPHQQSVVARLRSAIEEFGGALLCDEVGMGKTFVALALSRECQEAHVVGPAVLQDMWLRAAASAGQRLDFVSTESLSRRGAEQSDKAAPIELLIVDEAHHFRNPKTKRYSAMAQLASRRPVLQMSATPVHNKRADLVALLSVFMGSSAEALTASQLGRIVIRRQQSSLTREDGIPLAEAPVWCDLKHDGEIARLLLELPPPLPPRNGGDGGSLVIHSLIRQWASSDAALRGALTRRLHRSIALVAALERGSYPSLPELSAWSADDDCVQLAFTEIVSTKFEGSNLLLPVIRQHAAAIDVVLQRLKASPVGDQKRAALVRSIRQSHNGMSVVAFSQYADTIEGLFRLLAPDGSVAALAGDVARVVGGRISRSEAIRRFAPMASGVPGPRRSEAVTLLLTTDLLSEGLNLQDAAVVVHLDLPWTPARMEQRLGRVTRMGSLHDRVFSYVLRPPTSAESLIHLERLLASKMIEARIVNDDFRSLIRPSIVGRQRPESTPHVAEDIRSLLQTWTGRRAMKISHELVGAGVAAPFDGFLALCSASGRYSLIAHDARGLTDNPARVRQVMRYCENDELSVSATALESAVDLVQRHVAGIRVTGSSDAPGFRAHARRAALKRIANITNRARPHERARVASLGALARSTLLARLGADAERRLTSLSIAALDDNAWMAAVSELGRVQVGERRQHEVVAMILLRKQ